MHINWYCTNTVFGNDDADDKDDENFDKSTVGVDAASPACARCVAALIASAVATDFFILRSDALERIRFLISSNSDFFVESSVTLASVLFF